MIWAGIVALVCGSGLCRIAVTSNREANGRGYNDGTLELAYGVSYIGIGLSLIAVTLFA